MKSPDKIKKGLRCPAWVRNHHLPCSECDYHGRDKPPCAIAVHEDALAYIEQLESQVPKWIPVTERLPEVGAMVLVHDGSRAYVVEYNKNRLFEDDYGYCRYFDDYTHWMPLPSAPEEVNE